MLGPTLETERLRLRPARSDDFEAWARMVADPVAMRFLGGPQSRPAAWRSMCVFTGAWIVRGFSNFSIVEKATGRWIGRAGPWQPEGWPGTEVAWALDRSAWGKGYATEAAARCIEWTFETLGWDEVIHVIDPANEASIAVALRLGSLRRGPTSLPWPFETVAADIYAQDRSTWRARCASLGAASDSSICRP
jgi:RimJ/RimL family protein N-acetyltransferase